MENNNLNTGMMWFDNTKRPLADKLADAIKYFVAKYSKTPTIFVVHPNCFEEVAGKSVRASKSVLVNNIWLCVGE